MNESERAPERVAMPGYYCNDGKCAIHIPDDIYVRQKITGPKLRRDNMARDGVLLFEGQEVRLYITRDLLNILTALADAR